MPTIRDAIHRLIVVILATSLVWEPKHAEALPSSQATSAGAGGSVTLEVGKTLQRTFSRGGSESFRIDLDAGQYLHAVVEQRGIDVAVALSSASGVALGQVDSPNGALGSEPIHLVAPAAGTYLVEVRPLDPTASGRYEINVPTVRSATHGDWLAADAWNHYAETTRLFADVDTAAALSHAKRAAALFEEALGPNSPTLAQALDLVGVLQQRRGELASAEPLHVRALQIHEAAQGPDHPDTASSATFLAELYSLRRDFVRAEPLFIRALTIAEKALGPDDAEVARRCNDLARLYSSRGILAKAEPLLRRAVAGFERQFGPNDLSVADSMWFLGQVTFFLGDRAKATMLLRNSLSIRERLLGPEHPSLARFLVGLSNWTEGDRVALLERAAAIEAKSPDPADPIPYLALLQLAEVNVIRGDLPKAESQLVLALSLQEKLLGSNDPRLAHSLTSLARLFAVQGKLDGAAKFAERALALRTKGLGPEDPFTLLTQFDVARIHTLRGDFASAAPILEQAAALAERVYNSNPEQVAQRFSEIAELYWVAGNLERAINYQARAGDREEEALLKTLPLGTENQKIYLLASAPLGRNQALQIQASRGQGHAGARRAALAAVLRRKGRALDVLADSVSALRRRAAPGDRELIESLVQARSRLSALLFGDAPRAEIERLEERIAALEGQVSSRSVELGAQPAFVTPEAVAHAIPAGAWLLEFVRFEPRDPDIRHFVTKRFVTPRYAVYMMNASGSIEWADLGEAAPIDRAIAETRALLRDPGSRPAGLRAKLRGLDELVMRPVRRLAGDSRRFLVSPDGPLNLVPFDALLDENDEYLVENYDLSYLTSGRDLLRLSARVPSRGPAVIVANPDFGAVPRHRRETRERDITFEASSNTPLAVLLSQATFRPLKGTAEEAEALAGRLGDATLLTGAEATEQAVVRLSGPRLLHIATHGFFFDAPRAQAPNARVFEVASVSPDIVGGSAQVPVNPLLYSGLALAGANVRSETGDGILTALEVAGLDLWGTKLVTLSACVTGVGEVKVGDGVYGLRRALVLAGSETQAVSLWPVSDAGTRDLMIAYYQRLVAGEGRSAAMRAVRLDLLRDPKRRHPFYWASFIVSGEWASLDGQRP